MLRIVDVHGFRWATVLATAGVLAGGVLYSLVEDGPSLFDGIWWALSTITTVGYGDQVPREDAGRLVGIGLMLLAPLVIGLVAFGVAQLFARKVEDDVLARLDDIARRLDALERR